MVAMSRRHLSAAFVMTVSLSACDKPLPGNPPMPEPPAVPPTASATASSAPEQPAPTATASAGLSRAGWNERVTMDADGRCTVFRSVEVECPPNIPCNPPPPHAEPVLCPEIEAHAKITKLHDGRCLAEWFPRCEPNVKCNPPAVELVLACSKVDK
jgi:hypothetical protein